MNSKIPPRRKPNLQESDHRHWGRKRHRRCKQANTRIVTRKLVSEAVRKPERLKKKKKQKIEGKQADRWDLGGPAGKCTELKAKGTKGINVQMDGESGAQWVKIS